VSKAEIEVPFSSLVTSPTDYAGAIEPAYFRQRIGRRIFLGGIQRRVPSFLCAVRDEVFPAYVKACAGERTHASIYGPVPTGWLEIDQRSKLPTGQEFAAVRKCILACASRFNLTVRHPEGMTLLPAAWACDVIAVTLWHWRQDPSLVLHFPFRSDEFAYGDWATALKARRYTVSFPAGGPGPNESLLECECRLLPLFNEQLRRDWKTVRGRGKDVTDKNADHHFEWFARFQVGGLLPRQIASRIRIPNPGKKSAQVSVVRTDEAHAIQRSLKSTADVLGLCPRPLPKGRPKKRP
jgi:hypothetical protein